MIVVNQSLNFRGHCLLFRGEGGKKTKLYNDAKGHCWKSLFFTLQNSDLAVMPVGMLVSTITSDLILLYIPSFLVWNQLLSWCLSWYLFGDILVQQYLERARGEFEHKWNEAPKVGKALCYFLIYYLLLILLFCYTCVWYVVKVKMLQQQPRTLMPKLTPQTCPNCCSVIDSGFCIMLNVSDIKDHLVFCRCY